MFRVGAFPILQFNVKIIIVHLQGHHKIILKPSQL